MLVHHGYLIILNAAVAMWLEARDGVVVSRCQKMMLIDKVQHTISISID